MKTLAGLPIDFPTLGWTAIDWIENYCVHGPGDVQGERVQLGDEDCRFFLWAYRLDPDTGRRLVTDADLSAPKGWAKSEDAGFAALYEAFGPCRFDGWDANGEPVGKPLTYPFVRCLATEEDQSTNTYRNVLYSLEHSPNLAADYDYDPGLTRTFVREPGGGEIRPSTSGDASKDGGLETFTVADEVHLYVLRVLQEMYRTVERNGRKRRNAQPWMLRTTTMFLPGAESIAEQNWREWETYGGDPVRALLEAGLLVDHREAPEIDVLDDAALETALVELYGEKAAFVDIPNIIKRDFRRAGADIPDACRYFLNQRVKASGRWMSEKRWDRILDRRAKLQPGDRIALGFDGSRTRDATTFVACRLRDGLLVPLGYWGRPPKLPRDAEWEVPDDEVHQTLEEIFDTYDVVRFYPDPHWWRQEVSTWHGRWPDVVMPFDTSKNARMVYAVERMNVDIDSRAVRHTGDRLLRRHVLNAYAVKTKIKLEDGRFGVVLSKQNRDSRDLIDLGMAAVLANEAKGDAIAAGALEDDGASPLLAWS